MPDFYKIKTITRPNGIIYDLYEYLDAAPGSVGVLNIKNGTGKLNFSCSTPNLYGYYSSSFECIIVNDETLYSDFSSTDPWKYRLNIRDATYNYFWGTLDFQIQPRNYGANNPEFKTTFISGFQRVTEVGLDRLLISGDTTLYVIVTNNLINKFENYSTKFLYSHPWRPGVWEPNTGTSSFIWETNINQDLFSSDKSSAMLNAILQTWVSVLGWSWTYGTHYFGYALLGEDGTSYSATETEGTNHTTKTITLPTYANQHDKFQKRRRLEFGKIAAQIQNNIPVGDFEVTGSMAVYLDEYTYEIPFDPTVVASSNDDGVSYDKVTEFAASDWGYVDPANTGTAYELDEAHNFVMNRIFGVRRNTFKGTVNSLIDYMLPCKFTEETSGGTVTHIVRVTKGSLDMDNKTTKITEAIDIET